MRAERQAPVVRLRLYHVPVYVVSEPRLIERVLVEQQEKRFIKVVGLRTAARRAFGKGLLTSDGDLWRRQQRILQPHFQPRQVTSYVPAIIESTRELLQSYEVGGVRDIHADASFITLRSACRALFGDAAWSARDVILRATRAVQGFFRAWERSYTPFPELLPTKQNTEYRRAIGELDRAVYALIASQRAKPVERDTILSRLVEYRDEHGKPLEDRQLRDELVTLFLASYETSSAAVAWLLYLVSTHSSVLERVRAEARSALDGLGAHALDARSAPYLYDVARETLRLYPSVPVFGREATESLDLDGVNIERGAQVLLSPWAVQRSERWYPHPTAFQPERWAALRETDLPRYAYFPFGGGARVCTGQHLAMREAVLIASLILSRVTLRRVSAEAPQVDLGVTMVPRAGTMQMRVEALWACK